MQILTKNLSNFSAKKDKLMDTVKDVYLTNVNVICNAGGYFRHTVDTAWTVGMHSFMQNKLYYVTKGAFDITVDGVSYRAESGDLFFIPAGTPHAYSDIDGVAFEKYWMHLDIYPSASHIASLSLPHKITVTPKSEVHRLFARYVKHAKSNTLVDVLYVKSIATALLAEYIRVALGESIPLRSVSETRIGEVLRYIEHNIASPLSVPSLAEEFHLHPNHFIRFFKTSTGYTPARYIKMKKMEVAKRYLEETELLVTEIMEKVGIEDVCSFSKQFKSIYSYAPREYRIYFKDTKHVHAKTKKG